jgi:integrase/recombinase XerD
VSLHQAAIAFDPDRNWDWLYRLTAKLQARRKAVRHKQSKLRPASEIANWAYRQLDAVQAGADRRPSAAIAYRDALLVGLLINCPMRLRNLAMIQIGDHLRHTGSGYVLEFTPEEVKTNRHLTLTIPETLTPYLQIWLDEWRPVLLTDSDTTALWLGIRGRAMADQAIYWRIRKATTRAFGQPINPHLFRDCAVTTIAIEDPEHIGITAPILGHTNPKTTEDHYIHANQVMAGRRYRNSIDLLRQQARKQIQKARS